MNLRFRVVCVLLLVLGGLLSLQSFSRAQGVGSELAEPVAADGGGDEAYVVLQSVDSFPSDGGEAVFEPGTAYEEVFTYSSVDPSSNRLVGLTRAAPLAHSAGVFVQAPSSSGDTSATPSPEASPGASETSDQSETAGPESAPSSTESSEAAEVAPPDACEVATDQTCDDLLGPIVGDPPSIPDLCNKMTKVCEEAAQLVNDIDDYLETGDPCDPDNTGQTCAEFIMSILGGFFNDDPCDSNDTGQTCDEWLLSLIPAPRQCEEPGEDYLEGIRQGTSDEVELSRILAEGETCFWWASFGTLASVPGPVPAHVAVLAPYVDMQLDPTSLPNDPSALPGPGSYRSCVRTLQPYVDWDDIAFTSRHEEGSLEVYRSDGNCSWAGDYVATVEIRDIGYPPLCARAVETSGGATGAGNDSAEAFADQEVPIWNYPCDFHGAGTVVEWSFRYTRTVVATGREASECSEYRAQPGTIFTGSQTPWHPC